LFQPKAQNTQQRTLPSTPTTQVVAVTTIPIASTQTQTSTPKSVTSEGTATVSPLKMPTSTVSQVKPAVKNNEAVDKPEEPMDTESSPLTEEEPTPPQTGTGTSCTTSAEPSSHNTDGNSGDGTSGMVGAGAGPDNSNIKIAPPTHGQNGQNLQKDRNDRVALVIGERQAAIVKPSILTHVIEGFVIQEATEPFPVSGYNQYLSDNSVFIKLWSVRKGARNSYGWLVFSSNIGSALFDIV